MNATKFCASCERIVYPLEVIRCFDQTWHRSCFRCHHCGMALSISNYHGHEKKPYCAAHNPKPTRFTVVLDTPELLRVAKNTRMYSSFCNFFRSGRNSGIDPGSRQSPQFSRRSEICVSSAPFRSTATEDHNGFTNAQSLTPPYQRTQCNCKTTPQTFTSSSAFPRLINESNQQNGPQSHDSTYNSVVTTTTRYVPNMNSNFQDQSTQSPSPQRVIKWAPYTNTDQGPKYRAIYDFEARDDDEVTFIEGDIILNGDPFAEGWMYGTVQRTGQFGMLPSNYVEPLC